MSKNSEFFLKEKPVKALVIIHKSDNKTYCGEVSDAIDSTYAHTVKIVSRMKDLGLLETEKKGRKKLLHLTEKGKEQAGIYIKLLSIYGENEKVARQELKSNRAFSRS